VLLTASLIDRLHDSSKSTVVYIIPKTRLVQKCIDNKMIFICSIEFLVPMKSTRWFKYDRELCGLFTHKSVPIIFEPLCIWLVAFEMLPKIKYAGL